MQRTTIDRAVITAVCACAMALLANVHADEVEYIWEGTFLGSSGTPPGDFADLAEGDTVFGFNTDDANELPDRTADQRNYSVSEHTAFAQFSVGLSAIELTSACDAKMPALVLLATSDSDDYIENVLPFCLFVRGGGATIQSINMTAILPPDSIWQGGDLPIDPAEFTEFLAGNIIIVFGDNTRRGAVTTFWMLTRLEIQPIIVCPGDTDGDLDVDLDDLLDVIANWGSDGSGSGDSNGDELVDLVDLLEVIANWSADCSS